MSLSVPPALESTILSDGIATFKTNFINFILPSIYAGAPSSVMTLTSTTYDPIKKILNVGGVVDKIGNVGLSTLNSTIANNVKSATAIGPFGINSAEIKAYPTDFNFANNSNGNATLFPAIKENVPRAPAPAVVESPNLVAILVPSIVGGLLLLSALGVLLCYCCKWCCFKKRDANLIEANNSPITNRDFIEKKE